MYCVLSGSFVNIVSEMDEKQEIYLFVAKVFMPTTVAVVILRLSVLLPKINFGQIG